MSDNMNSSISSYEYWETTSQYLARKAAEQEFLNAAGGIAPIINDQFERARNRGLSIPAQHASEDRTAAVQRRFDEMLNQAQRALQYQRSCAQVAAAMPKPPDASEISATATELERARILAALEKLKPDQTYTRREWAWEQKGALAMWQKMVDAVNGKQKEPKDGE